MFMLRAVPPFRWATSRSASRMQGKMDSKWVCTHGWQWPAVYLNVHTYIRSTCTYYVQYLYLWKYVHMYVQISIKVSTWLVLKWVLLHVYCAYVRMYRMHLEWTFANCKSAQYLQIFFVGMLGTIRHCWPLSTYQEAFVTNWYLAKPHPYLYFLSNTTKAIAKQRALSGVHFLRFCNTCSKYL